MAETFRKLAELISACVRIRARKPRDLRHILGMTHFAATQIQNPDADTRNFVMLDWQEIFPGPFNFRFHSFPGVGASISLLESATLAALIKRFGRKGSLNSGLTKGFPRPRWP